jgi:hypothetical protein
MASMSPPVSRICLALALAAAAAAAHADIYTWVDKKGVTNVSNLPPPDDAKVTNVLRTQPKDAAREAAAREAARQAEVRALAERVQQLQSDVEQARREPPPVLAYAPPPPPYAASPTLNIVNVVQPAQPSYAPAYGGCDYSFGDCGFGVWPGFVYYGGTFAGGRGKGFRHGGAGHHGNQIVPPLIPLPPGFGGGRGRAGPG